MKEYIPFASFLFLILSTFFPCLRLQIYNQKTTKVYGSPVQFFLILILIFLDHDIRILCCIENDTMRQMQSQINDCIDVLTHLSKDIFFASYL